MALTFKQGETFYVDGKPWKVSMVRGYKVTLVPPKDAKVEREDLPAEKHPALAIPVKGD